LENEKLRKIAISSLLADAAFFALMTVFLIKGEIEMYEWVLYFLGDVLIAIPLSLWLLFKSR